MQQRRMRHTNGSRHVRRLMVGVLLGLAASAVALRWSDRSSGIAANRPSVALASDCDGSLSELVLHYVPEAAGVVVPVYRDFLPRLPRAVPVHVVCPDRRDLDGLAAAVGAC